MTFDEWKTEKIEQYAQERLADMPECVKGLQLHHARIIKGERSREWMIKGLAGDNMYFFIGVYPAIGLEEAVAKRIVEIIEETDGWIDKNQIMEVIT